MKVRIKTKEEIDKIRQSCQIASYILNELILFSTKGVNLLDIEKKAEKLFKDHNVMPAFLNFGYPPFPSVMCVSVNDVVVHGIPYNYTLKKDDVVTIDIGVNKDGYFGDTARTVKVDSDDDKLMKITKGALNSGISQARVGNQLGDISYAIQNYVESKGFNVIRQGYGGHGVGLQLHEEPTIFNHGSKKTGIKLKQGMVLAIEPMVSSGSPIVRVLNDKWAVATIDGSPCAHYEHTILITNKNPEILTSYK